MVLKKEGSLFRRRDGKYLIYIPSKLAEDSQFPFNKLSPGQTVKVLISVDLGKKRLLVNGGEREAASG